MNDYTKRMDKIDLRIDVEAAKTEVKFEKLWEVAMQRITAAENKFDARISEVHERSSANYQKIILLALMGLGSVVIALLELIAHHA